MASGKAHYAALFAINFWEPVTKNLFSFFRYITVKKKKKKGIPKMQKNFTLNLTVISKKLG